MKRQRAGTSCALCPSAARYTCPRCAVATCSLACCRRHKTENDCSGQRDKTAYVAVRAFDDRTLRSDVQLLTEIERSADRARRDNARSAIGATSGGRGGSNGRGGRGRRGRRGGRHGGRGRGGKRGAAAAAAAPPPLPQLVDVARERGTELLRMPEGMTRRDENTSRYDAARRAIAWRVQWIFVVDDGSIGEATAAASGSVVAGGEGSGAATRHYTLTQVDAALEEDRPLRDALETLLAPDPVRRVPRYDLSTLYAHRTAALPSIRHSPLVYKSTTASVLFVRTQERAAAQYRLRKHRACAVDDLRLYLKRERIPANSTCKYAALSWTPPPVVEDAKEEAEEAAASADADAQSDAAAAPPPPPLPLLTLRSALKGQIILEFPSIYVALPAQRRIFEA